MKECGYYTNIRGKEILETNLFFLYQKYFVLNNNKMLNLYFNVFYYVDIINIKTN